MCNEFPTEVSEIKLKLNQHIVETKAELQQIKEYFADQLDQLKELNLNGGTKVTEYCLTSLAHDNATLRHENTQLRRDNDDLRERFSSCSYIVSDLNTKIKNIEDEKLSLVTALKLLHARRQQICIIK